MVRILSVRKCPRWNPSVEANITPRNYQPINEAMDVSRPVETTAENNRAGVGQISDLNVLDNHTNCNIDQWI